MTIHLSDHFKYKQLLKFTFPSVIMMVFSSIYGIVDGLFVANFVGKSALAAVNFVYPVLYILSTFGYMLGTGGSALVAKVLGEGKNERANNLFSLFVYLSTFLGIVFALAGLICLKPLLEFLGANGDMLKNALQYGYILLLTLPFWNLQYLFQIFFITAEKPKLGLFTTLSAGITNMLLDALFILVFDMGITGAALATALSQLIGGGIPLIYFASKNTSLLHLGKTIFDIKATVKAFSNGISELVSGISGSLVGILFNTQLIKYASEDGVAAYGVMMYISMLFVGIFFGYCNGVAPIISYNYGAQNHGELNNLYKKSLSLVIASSLTMFCLSQMLAVPLSKIFAGYDANLYLMTIKGFRLYSSSFLFAGVPIFASSFFTALNNGFISATVSFLRTVVFQVLCVMLLPLLWNINGIWISTTFAEILSSLVAAGLFLCMRKKYEY